MNKISISSMRVLQMLQLLFVKSYTMDELVGKMTEISGESFNNFVISKYINTCRYCGMDIQKIDNKYTLLKLPFNMNLSDEELDLLSDITKFCSKIRAGKTVRNMSSLISKLNQRTDKYLSRIEVKELDEITKNFEDALELGLKVDLKYKTEKENFSCVCEPIEASFEDDLPAFVFNIEGERLRILKDDILSLKLFRIKSARNPLTVSVVFKLKSVLAKRYTLRVGEKVVATDEDGAISILNKDEDKDTLLCRLLRYGDLCEIVTPAQYREDFLQLIDRTLENYK